QGLPGLTVALLGENVLLHAAVRAVLPPDLLAAGPGRLAGRSLAAWEAGVLLELVGAVEGRHVERGREAGADAEAVDRRLFRCEARKLALVEAAAGEDGDVAEAAVVEPDASDGDAGSLQARRQRDDLVRRALGVIGVDQQDQIVGARAREGFECRRLVVVG